jgi:capsular exopolysaccharide synthesis family protein
MTPETPKAELVAALRPPLRLTDGVVASPMSDPAVTFAQAIEEESDRFSFHQLSLAFRRNRLLVCCITLASVVASVVYTRLADPVYESNATIRIDDKDAGSSMLTGIATIPGMNREKIQTEIEVLRSRQLAENVAKELHLNLEVRGSETSRSTVRVLNLPDDMVKSEITLNRRSPGVYEVHRADQGAPLPLPALIEAGTPFSIGAGRLVVDTFAHVSPEKITLTFRPLRTTVTAMRKKLTVSRPNREAQIVNVKFESNDPVLAASVPNLLLEQFIRYKAQTNKTEATSTVDFLRQQVASYQTQLKAAESALGSFRESAQVVSIGDEASAQVKRMADLQAERDQLRSERRALAEILAKPSAPGQTVARDVAAFPSFITNRGMQDILQSLNLLENERAQLLVRRNPQNADVLALTQRINALDGQLTQMARAYLAGVDSKLTSVDASIRSFGRQIETIPAREIAFARLSRDQKLLEDIFTLLQTRLKEAEIKEAVEPGDVRVLDPGLVPDRPTSPIPGRNILLGLLIGLGLGIAAAVAREMLDNKVRTKEDVQSVTGRLPILAAIPRIEPAKQKSVRGTKALHAREALTPDAKWSGTLITRENSRELFAEAYRALRTSITFAALDHPNRVLVLTSALAGDGKSTTAANLAVTLALQGARTLLIDADLRKGILHQRFGLDRAPGLTKVLVGHASIAEAVHAVSLDDSGSCLHVLTTGLLPPNPAELLGSERMRMLVSELRHQFDTIVFDTPPLTMVTDAAVLGAIADSTILVARAGATDKRALHQAAAQLYYLRVHVSGTIINDFDPRQTGYGYEYGYGHASGYAYAYGSGAEAGR